MSTSFNERLPELETLERIFLALGSHARIEKLASISVDGETLPIHGLVMGSEDPKAPVLGLFGGVHGLERIGTRIILSYLQSLASLLSWDETVHHWLSKSRLIAIPLINPGGMYLKIRSNPQGVDLMRNAPIEGDLFSRFFLFAGHRISRRIPWYRGQLGGSMEIESQAVEKFVRAHAFASPLTLSIDFHSGFGIRDRLWFPYAKTKKPFSHLAEAYSLKTILDESYPNHVYDVEPQSMQYRTHGDLWDYLYDAHRKDFPQNLYIPFCLELGSWIWVKKNPRQVFSLLGAFNPLKEHRTQRILRRHMPLIDFFWRAVLSSRSWADMALERKTFCRKKATALWYDD